MVRRCLTPVEIRRPPPFGRSLGAVDYGRPPNEEVANAMRRVAGTALLGNTVVYKTYDGKEGTEVVEDPGWTGGAGARRATLDAFVDRVVLGAPTHYYAVVELHGDNDAFRRAQKLAPIPPAYEATTKPDRLCLIVSRGGVLLQSHCDTSGGLLVLARSSRARGQVIFGDRFRFQGRTDPFRAWTNGERDSKGCAWTSVAELLSDGDAVHLPSEAPHAVRWGGLRLCVAYFADY